MSQQINLFDPALLKRRELLTLPNLAAATLGLLLAVGGWGAWERSRLAALDQQGQAVSSQLKTLQDQLLALGRQLAAIKPDPRLEAELAAARATLALRGEIVVALKKGLGAGSGGFAEYLRGLARQAPRGLWLTGFAVGESGAMEIRGRMTDPALLTEYIRRLNAEPAFQGRSFAALKIGTPAAPTGTGAPVTATAAPAAKAPAYLEFTLIPVRPEAAPDAGRATEGKR